MTMRAEISIQRTGAHGYVHTVKVHCVILPAGGYSATVAEDVPRMAPSHRTGEMEWVHSREPEFRAGDRITLARAELTEFFQTVHEFSTLCSRARELLAA